MSSLPGGPADKAGLSHEALWGVDAMLQVLLGHAKEIRIEPPGVDGAEFYVETSHGREYWQAKRQLLSQQTWTLHALNREGVLRFFLDRLRAGETCVFASISDAPELRILGENSTQAQDYPEFESKFLSGDRREQLRELCGYWQGIRQEDAFDYLRRTRVEGAREISLERLLLLVLEVSFNGSPQAVLDCLRQLYLESVHKTLTAKAIEIHLETRSIKRRASALAPSICDKLLRLTDSYLAGQRTKLIRGQSIPRQISGEIVEKLKGSTLPLDIAFLGSAGSGKSAGLFQVVSTLREYGVPVLAFRLDRVEPVQTTIALGEQFGLPESPAVVLARCYPGQKCVLVIDQLDFVSSTSGRHPDFFDTVAALIEEVQGLRATSLIHLVLACRKFDFEHDHRLRKLLRKKEKPIELALLSGEEVEAIVSISGGKVELLSTRQIELLRLPQNLSLFIEGGLLQQSKPAFISQKDLFDAYWEAKQREIAASHPNEMAHWRPLINKVTSEMSERQELSIPKSQLDDFPLRFVTALVSAGVLSLEGNRYGFGHESLFDYCFARSVAAAPEEFVTFLENDEQQLFRRAQLRQVLVYLRDDDFNRYLKNVQLALTSPNIRPHLKVLTLELIAALSDPRDEELRILMPFIESELDCRCRKIVNPKKIASRAFEIFFHSASMFRVADRLGHINSWLNSREDWLEDLMTSYLRRQTDENADRVAELVEPFIGRCPWLPRLRYLMEWRSHHKGRKFFELFLRLIDDGTLDDARDRFATNGTFWSMLHGLSESRPEWCAEVAAHWLGRQVVRGFAQKVGEHIPIEIDDDFGIEDLFESARRAPEPFLDHVLPAIIRASDATKYQSEGELPRDQIWSGHIQSEHISLAGAYLGACSTAFTELATSDVEKIRPFMTMLRNSRLYVLNHLLQQAYLTAPGTFAEEAISLLLGEPERLDCGFSDSRFWLSRSLIGKCSPHCLQPTFEGLEALLLNFTTPYERSPDGLRASGYASFNLLSALCPQRRTTKATVRLEELQRKFKAPEEPPRGAHSYSITSPIPKEAADHMTDDNWLEAIAKYNKPLGMPEWKHPEKGGAWELAGMLQQFAEKEPERFARLALRFPPNADASYFRNVLYALKKATIPAQFKIDLVRRVIPLEDNACTKAVLDVLGSINVYPLPDDLSEFIRVCGVEHPDPARGERQEELCHNDVLTEGINSVRGRAAETVRDLIWHDRRFVDLFLPVVTQMVKDKTIPVRACVASTLIAIARHDIPSAISLFSHLADTDDHLLATHHAERFLFLGLREQFENLRGYVERMLRSGDAKVKQVGGRLASLARLYHRSADELAERALNGDNPTRLGVAEIAEANLTHPDCRQWCETVLVKLFDDRDEQVRNKAGRCFWHLWKRTDVPLTDFNSLIAAFLHSKAFSEDPSMLLHALEDTRKQIPEITLEVCEEFVNKCARQARDISTALAADEHTIGVLVFRSYAQFQALQLKLRALSLIDRMCEEGLQSASQKLLEFDR